jgi:molybdate transport system regulatory protein
MVEETARILDHPVVETRAGGTSGGGAKLTPAGEELVTRFRMIEQVSASAAKAHLEALEKGAAVRR